MQKTELWTVRGAAMVHTLVLVGLVMLAAFCLAASTVSHLQLSTRYLDRTRGDNVARAALVEFNLRLQAYVPEDITQTPPSALSYFTGRETLLAPSAHLDGRARLLLDRCRDNGTNDQPIASYYDEAGHRSVPPFGLSLIYEVEAGHSRFIYESLLQQRWPYALAAPGPIMVCGRLGPEPGQLIPYLQGFGELAEMYASVWSAPSRVEGRILATRAPAWPVRAPTVIQVSQEMYKPFYFFASHGGVFNGQLHLLDLVDANLRGFERLQIGGRWTLPALSRDPEGVHWAQRDLREHSTGALVKGSVDLWENPGTEIVGDPPFTSSSPGVVVGAGCTLTGQVRPQVTLHGVERLFLPPKTSDWPAVGPASSFRDGKGRVGLVHGSSLALENYSLAVDGDLYLTEGSLRGANATLIVKGDLVLTDSDMDSGGNGLVIFCRRLLLKANGRFNGLIIAQQGAAIYGDNSLRPNGQGGYRSVDAAGGGQNGGAPPPEPLGGPAAPTLEIRGGLLVGGNSVEVGSSFEPTEQSKVDPARVYCLVLAGTVIKYDPRYLRGLNRQGDFTALATELRE